MAEALLYAAEINWKSKGLLMQMMCLKVLDGRDSCVMEKRKKVDKVIFASAGTKKGNGCISGHLWSSASRERCTVERKIRS